MRHKLNSTGSSSILPASIWSATISGIVGAPAPGTPVAGVTVYLRDGNSTGPKIDSTVSSVTGAYTFSNVATGAKTLQAGKAGYNTVFVLVGVNTAGQTITQNLSLTINNNTSSLVGTVRKASDSTVLAGVTVTLSGNAETGRTKVTDSLGNYRFDSVGTGTGYTVAAALTGYNSTSVGGISAAWNSSTTVGTMYLTRNLGTLSGTIRRTDSTTVPIQGAKVVVSIAGTKVDSTTTDVNGQYTLTVNAAAYTVSVSKAGYKSNIGMATKDTTATVTFGSNTTLNVNLTPAISTITGTVTRGTTTPASGAKVVLARRINNQAATPFTRLDSTTTDANGIFVFSNLIAAQPATQGQYRLFITMTPLGSTVDYPNGTAQTNLDTITVAVGGTATRNVTLTNCAVGSTLPGCAPAGILPLSSSKSQDIRFSTMGDRLILDMGVSNAVRTVSIFGLNGTVQYQVNVPAGESQAVVPATLSPANGYLFMVK